MRRNLIIGRAGDASLHSTWLGREGAPRNWDFHISYYGKQPAPFLGAPDVTWSPERDSTNKWHGVAATIAKGIDLDKYDYVALPDDDIILGPEDWNQAFDICRQYDIRAAQLSLDHRSFFGELDTLQRPFLKLRYVSVIELMPPIFRTDTLKALLPYFTQPGNGWAMDHVLAAMLKDDDKAIAVIDAVRALHTRAFWTGPLYDAMRARGEDAGDASRVEETQFLTERGMTRMVRTTAGGVSKSGKSIANVGWLDIFTIPARARRKFRDTTGVMRIALGEQGKVYCVHRVKGAAVKIDKRKALMMRRESL